ncbi:MAG: 4-vinyl reductase, partial [Fibromonadaceae bacterium]|nr:4-vinyl reductase [Fibromonadaceae bacterium]
VGADLDRARPNLGPVTRVEVYRLFQFTIRDVLEQNFGTKAADTLFREAGIIAGKAFFDEFLKDTKDATELAVKVQSTFNTLGIGIFRVEAATADNSLFVFTVDEDLDCSGLPDTSDMVCVYDEGFIQGILKAFSGKDFEVREVDCWSAGARTCRFEARVS